MTEDVQFINGEWMAGTGPVFQSINPSNDETLWQAAAADASQVQMAVASARTAFEAWSDSSFEARINVINRFAELLSDNTEHLATVIAKETGKALWESKTEIGAMVGKIAISVKAYHQRTGSVESVSPALTSKLRHKPHGVVAIFGPYNFPGHLPNGHIVPALIAGNTIVFKPSDLTPWVGQEMVKLWQQAGLPNGVLNLVQGKVDTGKALAGNADIDGLFFTGSSTTGHLLHEQFAGHPGKILALEMGGNNPLIVKNVKNIDAAVHDIVQSAFVTTGQRCTCARRLFIEDTPNGDAILAKLITVTESLKIDQPFAQEQPFFGAMVSKEAAAGMVAAQRDIIELGGRVLVELQHKKEHTGFVTPGIIDVTDAKPLPDVEHFGPLLKVYRYNKFDQAIIEANNTEFGLSAGFIGDDENDYHVFFKRIRAGIVNWNKPTTGASSAAPFGGIGASGNHRASAFYAADYCAYPVASVEANEVALPATLAPGITL